MLLNISACEWEDDFVPHATPPRPMTRGKMMGTPSRVVVVVTVVSLCNVVYSLRVVGANLLKVSSIS